MSRSLKLSVTKYGGYGRPNKFSPG